MTLVFLGVFFLNRYFKPSNLSSKPQSTNLINYVVIAPYSGSPLENSENKRTEEEKRELYRQAKKIIESLPSDFRSKVDFNDRDLEIGFKYGATTLSTLANHDKLWVIFSGENTSGYDSIFNSNPNKFCVKNLDMANVQLIEDQEKFRKTAENFFKNEAIVHPVPDFESASYGNYSDLLSAIFKKFKGLSIADIHRQIASKYFLVSQMEALADHIDTLFMEGLCESLQKDLDAYFDPKIEVEHMPLSIQYTFGYLEEILKSKGGYTYTDIIKAAKRAGIKRIVGIDTPLSHEDQHRLLTMNYFGKQVIDREMPDGNYAILSGASHAASVPGSNPPSFSQLFGIPSILVYDAHVSMMTVHHQEIAFPTLENPNRKLRCNFSVGIPLGESKKRQAPFLT